jgi:hypothetical protein
MAEQPQDILQSQLTRLMASLSGTLKSDIVSKPARREPNVRTRSAEFFHGAWNYQCLARCLEKGQTGAGILLTVVLKETPISGACTDSKVSNLVVEVAGRLLKRRTSSGDELCKFQGYKKSSSTFCRLTKKNIVMDLLKALLGNG